MAYKPVGVDENGFFPSRVITALKTLFLGKTDAATVATTGKYSDLVQKPSVSDLGAEPSGLSDTTKNTIKYTYLAMRSTVPTAAERSAGVVAYIDTSVTPPVGKGWDGSAWVFLGSSGSGGTTPTNSLTTQSGDYLTTQSGDILVTA